MGHRFVLLSMVFFLFHAGYSQISIEECYEKAEANYPLIRQYGLIEKAMEYNLSNASKGYLPQFQVSGKVSYQSEVTQIPIEVAGLKGLSKDQYSATVDLNQNIWDGGTIKAQQESIRTQAEIDKKNLEVTLYAIRERVNQLFFGILLYDEMLGQNTLYQEELQRNFIQVLAYMENGIANQSDLEAVEVEQVQTSQNRIELIHNKKAYLEILSALIGEKIDESTELIKPAPTRLPSLQIQRPELLLYDAQFQNLEARKKEINAGLMPKFNLFITGGYGKPGLNMLEDKFSAYYIGGISLNWNLSNFYTKRNNLNNLEVNRSTIETQRETFLFNTGLDATQSENEIQKISQLLNSDNDIIRLRESVKRSAEAKVANGTLSVLDLMKEVNAEQLARQDKIVHEIQLLQAIYNLKYIINN
ncbi:MAG: TolC family protein [Candidatus Azobacteroides sp.]|nr:TolC family protein [Candidatus Azobacteroides sp.]